MYESFFGLARRPFAATPDPDCLVPVPAVERARESLAQCLATGQGVAVLTAAPGLGKTLVLRRLARDFADSYAVVLLPRSDFTTRRAFLQAVLAELGRPYARLSEQELRLELERTVRDVRPAREAVLLLLDEAHGLGDRLLEEVRNSALLACDGQPLFRIVLCGQPELEERLADPALAALNQRVACHAVLEPLTRDESREYLAARLAWAGARLEDCFEPEAVDLVCRASDGNPRCLNHLADHALLLACVDEQRPVSVEVVRQALDDLRRLPLPWNEPLRADASDAETSVFDAHATDTQPRTATRAADVADDPGFRGAARVDRRSCDTTAACDTDDEDAADLIVDDLFDVSSAWDRDAVDEDVAADLPHEDGCHVLEVGELADARTAWFAHPTDDVPETRRATDVAAAHAEDFDRLEVRASGGGPDRTRLLLTADPWAPGDVVEFGTFFDGDDDSGDGADDAPHRFEVPASDLASLGAGGERPANPESPSGPVRGAATAFETRSETRDPAGLRSGRPPLGPIAGPSPVPADSRPRDARLESNGVGSGGSGAFEDVPVVDRYARLDAGLSVDGLPVESWRRIVAGTTERRAVPRPSGAPVPAMCDPVDMDSAPLRGAPVARIPRTAARDDWSIADPLVAPERTAACEVFAWPASAAEPESLSGLEPADAFDPSAGDEVRGGPAATAADDASESPERPHDPLAAWESGGEGPGGRQLSRRRLDGFLRLLDEALAAVVEPEAETGRDTIFPEDAIDPDLAEIESEARALSEMCAAAPHPAATAAGEDLEDRVSRDVLDVCRETRALVAGLEADAFRTADADPLRGTLPPRFDVVEPETDVPLPGPHALPQRRYARLFSALRGRRPAT